jgi:hypothetical protein
MVKDASRSPDVKKKVSLTIFSFYLEVISGSSTALASHFRPSSRRPVTGCHCARFDILINVTQTRADAGPRRPALGRAEFEGVIMALSDRWRGPGRWQT